MTAVEQYLNLEDVADTLDKDSYAYQTLNNVMVAIYDELTEADIKQLTAE
ncbi:hypothetical protein [Staphylococcus equorum]|nr:hypothetical protein [Staphylococcus equorum]